MRGQGFQYVFWVAQKGNSVDSVLVFGRTHVGFETFYEGGSDEMLPGCQVVHVLASAGASLSVNRLATVEIERESLSGAHHGIEGGWERGRRGRGRWALRIAVTFPEGFLGSEQVLCEAHVDVLLGDVFEEDAGFRVAGVMCLGGGCCGVLMRIAVVDISFLVP